MFGVPPARTEISSWCGSPGRCDLHSPRRAASDIHSPITSLAHIQDAWSRCQICGVSTILFIFRLHAQVVVSHRIAARLISATPLRPLLRSAVDSTSYNILRISYARAENCSTYTANTIQPLPNIISNLSRWPSSSASSLATKTK
jgi:hypothetical protein